MRQPWVLRGHLDLRQQAEGRRDPRMSAWVHRPNRVSIPRKWPFIWFGLQFLELTIVIPTVLAVVPDAWSEGLRWGVLIAIVVGLTPANYAIRRRFIPR
jgi:hypothetical protein